MASVQRWASTQGYEYRFIGDALLEMVPDWYRTKVAHRGPIVTDLARLLWIREILAAEDVDQVIWLDADTVVFFPAELEVQIDRTCVFGREYWLQLNRKGKQQTYKNVHNAYCAFRKDCPVLAFLIFSIERMVAQVDAEAIAPQFVGPKLLSSLHNIVGFQADDRFGAISPLLAQTLLAADAQPEAILKNHTPNGMYAANVCLSLADEIPHEHLVELLLALGD